MVTASQLASSGAIDIHKAWRSQIVSTESIDKRSARQAIELLYDALALPPPRAVILVASPLQAVLALRMLLNSGIINGQDRSLSAPGGSLTTFIAEAPKGGVAVTVRNLAQQVLATPIEAALSDHHLLEVDRAARDAVASIIRVQTGLTVELRSPEKIASSAGWAATDLPACMGALAQLDFWKTTLSGCLSTSPTPIVEALDVVCRNCGWSVLLESIAIVSDRPAAISLQGLEEGHAREGALHAYRDGFEIRARQGVVLPAWLISSPHRVTVQHIERETNAEMRRLLLETMGIERYLKKSRARKISEDDTGVLWRRSLSPRAREWRPSLQPLTFVEVVNGTAEPDGSYRRYFLRVPPWVTTAREAVAWTYGLSEEEYRPTLRT